MSEEVRGFIRASLAENNKSLLDQFSKLVAESAEGIKRSSVDTADEQLREIKKMRREEPKSFKRRGNEVQYKFNAKLQDSLDDVKSHLDSNAVEKAKASLAEGTSLISDRQKLILLADKSDFGWKTVDEYVQHELADTEEDAKRIRRAEDRAEKVIKSAASKKVSKQSPAASRSSSSRSLSSQNVHRGSSTFGPLHFQRHSFARSSGLPSRQGNCFACGRFGHWRSECSLVSRVPKGNSDAR